MIVLDTKYRNSVTFCCFFFQSRDIDRTQKPKVREANYYYFIESSIALAISFVINVFVVSVFAHGLYNKTNRDVVSIKYKYLPNFMDNVINFEYGA